MLAVVRSRLAANRGGQGDALDSGRRLVAAGAAAGVVTAFLPIAPVGGGGANIGSGAFACYFGIHQGTDAAAEHATSHGPTHVIDKAIGSDAHGTP